jgi:hypothetical protein
LGAGFDGGSESNATIGAFEFVLTAKLLTSTGSVFGLLLDRFAEGRDGEAFR